MPDDASARADPEIRVSALVVVRNAERHLADCLDRLRFADEIVVVLDRCTDLSKTIASRFTDRLVEGGWEYEGDRRNLGILECGGQWILEVDADERVAPQLADEIRRTIQVSGADWHLIPIDNHIGERLIRHGWGGSFGVSAKASLFRTGAKRYRRQRVHPGVELHGRQGPALQCRLDHFVHDNISDMICRLDRYTTARAKDLREAGCPETFRRNLRRMLSRFYKCYVRRRGYKEGAPGFLIAVFAALYPMLSYLKAVLEDDAGRPRRAGSEPFDPPS